MSVKRTTWTAQVQDRGIRMLREALEDKNVTVGLDVKLRKALTQFETAGLMIRELERRAKFYRERDKKEKASK